ncbi:D-alanine--D-alanine ligase [Piscirickettsia salmonis]|uniref:D-alanine--D-alanine ligase n=1 Tax=Piscirickettsia salmonis TaxID=1238 RepID=UPI0012BAB4B2|nr:D-alanine--D-alanine ligase [Piscirickettsia salmonis]QGP52637.1 D-alanine--D-alanine ligase [Piscirickettsia salmonis]QGP57492.1 D-alanine--D-alanine ligase [Piscirickettsia salmonis]QGP62205.1 D-alanine--D-alanine ligase [Piscirickettsia salmonis]
MNKNKKNIINNNSSNKSSIKEQLPSLWGKVAVLMGGDSAEREVSLDSGSNVLAALLRQGVDAHGIDPADQGFEKLIAGGFDRAFNILHGRGGEDGQVQALLEILKLPYTGSGILGSALSMDKMRTKHVWSALDLPTPEAYLVSSVEQLEYYFEKLAAPVAVKPVHDGSTIGVSRVEAKADCQGAYDKAQVYGQVMVERWVCGEEYTVGILAEKALPLIKIIPAAGFYDYEAKYLSDETQYACPCGLDQKVERWVQDIALQAFMAVDCRGWGRVDVMRDHQGRFWLLEVNTTPGMTSHSLVPKAAKQSGMSFDELVLAILAETITQPEHALESYRAQSMVASEGRF